ncbi:hypothetical protein [Paenibacillus sp. FSL R10-2771]|uniref:hypothetical protein n=1 Tax=Paenibacillus sp. FSL R10-2771 TaxID=2954693 RepID=UPI0030F78548
MVKTAKAGDDNMKDFSWRLATLNELYAVIHDQGAQIIYRRQAAEEISRRTGRRYALVNFKIKPKY